MRLALRVRFTSTQTTHNEPEQTQRVEYLISDHFRGEDENAGGTGQTPINGYSSKNLYAE